MAQITLYLDEDTEILVAQAAKAKGISKSRWVAEAIRQYAHDTWPAECLALAGAFPDFPLREDSPSSGEDLPRIGF
ncbi:MAG TPA: CopG family transcriptional regulator [Bordetella sp.]